MVRILLSSRAYTAQQASFGISTVPLKPVLLIPSINAPLLGTEQSGGFASASSSPAVKVLAAPQAPARSPSTPTVCALVGDEWF